MREWLRHESERPGAQENIQAKFKAADSERNWCFATPVSLPLADSLPANASGFDPLGQKTEKPAEVDSP